MVRITSHKIVVAAALVLTSFACADRREAIVREQLAAQVASQSNGALSLQSMTKTNGFDHEREGMKLHTIEWEATLLVQATGWKARWRDHQVMPAEPNALAAAVEGLTVRRVVKGSTATLQGKSELQKADRGWRVLQSEVTAFKVVPPPYALSSFPELPTFIHGCHTVLALSEADFNRRKYIYADDLDAQAFMIAGDAPTVLRFVKEIGNVTPPIKEYSNGPLAVRVKIESAGDAERESNVLRGELTVMHGTTSATEKVFGEQGC